MREINCTFGRGGEADCKSKDRGRRIVKKVQGGLIPKILGMGRGRDQMHNCEEDVQLPTLIG